MKLREKSLIVSHKRIRTFFLVEDYFCELPLILGV